MRCGTGGRCRVRRGAVLTLLIVFVLAGCGGSNPGERSSRTSSGAERDVQGWAYGPQRFRERGYQFVLPDGLAVSPISTGDDGGPVFLLTDESDARQYSVPADDFEAKVAELDQRATSVFLDRQRFVFEPQFCEPLEYSTVPARVQRCNLGGPTLIEVLLPDGIAAWRQLRSETEEAGSTEIVDQLTTILPQATSETRAALEQQRENLPRDCGSANGESVSATATTCSVAQQLAADAASKCELPSSTDEAQCRVNDFVCDARANYDPANPWSVACENEEGRRVTFYLPAPGVAGQPGEPSAGAGSSGESATGEQSCAPYGYNDDGSCKTASDIDPSDPDDCPTTGPMPTELGRLCYPESP